MNAKYRNGEKKAGKEYNCEGKTEDRKNAGSMDKKVFGMQEMMIANTCLHFLSSVFQFLYFLKKFLRSKQTLNLHLNLCVKKQK